ncbi:L-histidine N(alpha)-methyltransferase [Candidatus Woesearchaeota archaeon]|nr:L-histidine N(alpha)-methyltransferase [Candidatus Woesearchaeota archaeon]
MRNIIESLNKVYELKNKREFEKALPLLRFVLESLIALQEEHLEKKSFGELESISKSLAHLFDTYNYLAKIVHNGGSRTKKFDLPLKFTKVLAELLKTNDEKLVAEYAGAVKYLIGKEYPGEELLVEGLLHEILEEKNIPLIIKSFRNQIFLYIMHHTHKSIPLDFPEAWSASDGGPMLKALLSSKYRSSYNAEKLLVEECIGDALRRVGSGSSELNYVDWGPGDGQKTAAIVRCAAGMFRNVNGYAVDCSATMLKASSLNIGKKGNVRMTEICTSFDKLAENEIYRGIRGKKFHSFLGTTFCNFDPKLICRTLKRTLGEGDHALIGVHLYFPNRDDSLIQAYKSREMADVSFHGLRDIGFSRNDPSEISYKVILLKGDDPKLGTLAKVITYFEVLKPMKKGLLSYSRGDQIPAILSIKYSERQFQSIMGEYFEVVKVYSKGEIGLFLVKNSS